ncbi:asparagine synthase (glutamine-hydrolyzing) [Thalassospira lucentensis]|uniref:asparagine synthase (glutamine-hydrolyzing) n=1 Tax=Thalassospira lucentensis TaxID=168935 RepID=UPI003D2F42DC
MCGFAAIIGSGNYNQEGQWCPKLLEDIDRDLYHRGPDDGRVICHSNCALIFRRLAIIDPEAHSNQPMRDETGRYELVFNGEIYNYKTLRSELEGVGCVFRTKGDTEALLQGFIIWGADVFARLEGMFSCVIIDHDLQQGYAARDSFGIKPLYITRKDGYTAFASEARPLRRLINRSEIDADALSELLMHRFAAGRLSNYQDIELLPGGRFVRFRLSGKEWSETVFSDPLDTLHPRENLDKETVLAQCENAISQSIKDHMQSDVGYALQLSGGVDSSLVLAMTSKYANRPLDSYAVSIDDDRYDEGKWRDMVTQQYPVRHKNISLTGKDFAEALPDAVKYMDGPVPHFGCVMLKLLCKELAQNHKVVLTGEGADEFFGGYDRYARWQQLLKFNRIAKLVPRTLWPFLQRYKFLHRFHRNDAAIVSSIYFDFMQMQSMFPDLNWQGGAREETARRFSNFPTRMMAVDQTSYLSSLLMRQDKMAMSASVEARVPFTHLPLARIVNSIGMGLRVPGGETKPLLKQIAAKWLPKDVVFRRKVGLNLPLDEWLKDEQGLGRYLPLLTESSSRLGKYADQKILRTMVENFRRGSQTPGMPPLAHLVNIELWLRSSEDLEIGTVSASLAKKAKNTPATAIS